MSSYQKALEQAKKMESFEQVESFLKSIENDENITDRQYYNLKFIALDYAYNFMALK